MGIDNMEDTFWMNENEDSGVSNDSLRSKNGTSSFEIINL